MRSISIIVTFAILMAFSATAQESTWAFDKAHSNIQFEIEYLGISHVTGEFHDYDGTVIMTGDDFEDAKIDFWINAKSIDTDLEMRDADLQSVKYLDSGTYPKMMFKSTSMKKLSDDTYKLIGDLTIHGVTKSVTLDVKYGGTIVDFYQNTKVGFRITGTIDRTDFGMTTNMKLDKGGWLVGELVDITCNVQLSKLK